MRNAFLQFLCPCAPFDAVLFCYSRIMWGKFDGAQVLFYAPCAPTHLYFVKCHMPRFI